MRAVVLDEQGLQVVERPIPEPASGEVLVRVVKAGLCETDLQLVKGYMGFQGILGHEFVGVPETGRFQGQRVVCEINCACHHCDYCERGLQTHCPNRTVVGILNRDGAFAEFIAVPERNLHPVPDRISDKQAVFTEPLAAAFQIPAQIPLNRHQRVIVLGDGRLGNLCAQVIALSGCKLTVVGKHSHKLNLLSALGIETALLGDFEALREADIVVDCTGSPTGMECALRYLKPRGILVLKTTVAGTQSLSLAPIVIDEFTVIGSRCGPFVPALAALRDRRIYVDSLVEATFPLSDAAQAFRRASTQPTLKLLFEP